MFSRAATIVDPDLDCKADEIGRRKFWMEFLPSTGGPGEEEEEESASRPGGPGDEQEEAAASQTSGPGDEGAGEEEGWFNVDAELALEAIYAIAPALGVVSHGGPADSSLVHALARLVGLLVAEGHEDGYTPFAPAGDVFDVDSPHAAEAASAEAAAVAAAAATMAAAAQRALTESQARLRLLCSEAVSAGREAEVQRERARSASARYEVLTDQLESTDASVRGLREQETAVAEAIAVRRAQLTGDEAALRTHEAAAAAEREAASRALRAAMERASAARSRSAHLRDGPMLGDPSWEGKLAEAEAEAAAATDALAAVQAAESARESARTHRLRASQRAVASNGELARIEREASEARLEALAYRRSGLEAQAGAVRAELAAATAELRSARPSAVNAATRAERLEAAVAEAKESVAAERRGARQLMLKANAAAEESLRAMALHDDEVMGEGAGYDAFGEGNCEAVGAEVRLGAATAELERLRLRAEELELLQDMVVVHTSVGGLTERGEDSCPNGRPADGSGATLEAARRTWVSVSSQLTKRLKAGTLGKPQMRALLAFLDAADAATGRRPASSVTAGAALLGGGIGFAAMGPVGGTALAGAAGAVAYAAHRRGGAAAAGDAGEAAAWGEAEEVQAAAEESTSSGVPEALGEPLLLGEALPRELHAHLLGVCASSESARSSAANSAGSAAVDAPSQAIDSSAVGAVRPTARAASAPGSTVGRWPVEAHVGGAATSRSVGGRPAGLPHGDTLQLHIRVVSVESDFGSELGSSDLGSGSQLGSSQLGSGFGGSQLGSVSEIGSEIGVEAVLHFF